ncbi:uncharacterized protein LOC127813096 [Diospyros lotus]|uniref:uncharacterized protein LOC127813096 n=1 Tax=Diospyros lotus TaxID=55363 RepID=UPI00224F5FC0|nr:uncharacterized protein LOC127813096 [Diospyros lotus]XP_052209826.1 uncharacterized protein LOC127813096 [Diospyros lotus]
MGDLQVCSRRPDGVVTEDRPFPIQFSSANPDPSSIGEDSWAVADQTIQEVIRCVHPTLDTDEKRQDVIEHVQNLIRCSLGCEVFPYGSVPLKTYLPDGDIDLTALSFPSVEETLALDVLAVMQGEEQNQNAEYQVKDTQFIDAEVKLVKCLVQNIVIDISFNQLGGLCTLCFLEQVDRLVGKDHLFKRSIMLIKAWCYYESRILGAHHGLISTYALETLVLYIFHLFHSSLNGPLAVLYKFLDYFSKFDWENYCISLKGPVIKSSLPDIVVEMPENVGDDLMLNEEFLRNCMDMFSVPSRGLETNLRAFPQKHLNIIDPLKENNNLGRSVTRGNFYRIRSAFKYGARKLGRILLLPRERIGDEVKRFFANTLERHGHKSSNLSSSSHSRTFSEEKIELNLLNLDLDDNIPIEGDSELDRYMMKDDSSPMLSKMDCSRDEDGVSDTQLAQEENLRNANHISDCSPSSCNFIDFCFSGLPRGNGMLCEENTANIVDKRMISDLWMDNREEHLWDNAAACSCSSPPEGLSASGSGISSPDGNMLERLPLDFREKYLADIAGSPESVNPLLDLTGDYDSHIRSLLYGQCCHGYALYAPLLSNPAVFPSQFENRRPWETIHRPMPLNQNEANTNGMVVGLMHNPINNNGAVMGLMHNPMPLNFALVSEENHEARGTGTYFPNSNGYPSIAASQWRQRNRATGNHGQFKRPTHNLGSVPTVPEKKSSEEGTNMLPHARSPDISDGKSGSLRQPTDPVPNESHSAGLSVLPQKLAFGSFGDLTEGCSRPASDNCEGWISSPGPLQGSKTVSIKNQGS